jgi:hypothetical protein
MGRYRSLGRDRFRFLANLNRGKSLTKPNTQIPSKPSPPSKTSPPKKTSKAASRIHQS